MGPEKAVMCKSQGAGCANAGDGQNMPEGGGKEGGPSLKYQMIQRVIHSHSTAISNSSYVQIQVFHLIKSINQSSI